ncbi:MAG: FAD-dependent oxidoreductase, partial [Actinophytocola sp.]|nr:FAD-dependent oxidoreductase [Actinophytocola sp.]
GLSVAVVERDGHATGASVRNFGHGCITAQDGIAFDYAIAARDAWVTLARDAGFWLRESGTLVAARAEDELAVLTEFAERRSGQVTLLTSSAVLNRVRLSGDVVGGALLPMDIRVNPREAVHAIAAALARRGVTFHWSTTAHTVTPGEVVTSRGRIAAGGIVVTVGHDVDQAVLTGFSMLRYDGFAACPSLPALRRRLTREHPEDVEAGLNLNPFLIERPADGVRVVAVTSGIGMTTALGLAPAVLDDIDHEAA